jgi:neurofibromin 1
MQSGFAGALENILRSNRDIFLQILQSLFASIDRVPPPVRRLVSVFQRSVQDFFPKSKYIVSTGYLFLRVIVPYITSPDGFGCYHRPIDQSGRRNLILVAKVLQNLANDALFGAKEAYMVGMNAFMGTALPQCQNYINELGRSPSKPLEVPATEDRSTIEDQMRLHRMLLKVLGHSRFVLVVNFLRCCCCI